MRRALLLLALAAALLGFGPRLWELTVGRLLETTQELSELGSMSEREYARARREQRERAGAPTGRDAPAGEPPTPPSAAERRRERDAGAVRARVQSVLASARGVAVIALGGALALAALGLLMRGRARAAPRRRRRIVPGRTDEASPEAIRGFMEEASLQTLRRWWQRLLFGQPSHALEISAVPRLERPGEERRGLTEIQYAVVGPSDPDWLSAFEGRLRSRYRDARIEPDAPAPGWHRSVLRLKKRYPLDRALATPDGPEYQDALADGLVATMQASGEPVSVQYVLTPAPALLDRLSRSSFRAQERDLARAREAGSDPGAMSEVSRRELRGGAEGFQHRTLFFTDIRIWADSLDTARAVAGTIRGASRAANQLVERHMRVRAALYRARVIKGLDNPLPSPLRGVFSSSELAGLWQFPSYWNESIEISRTNLPHVNAPPGAYRPPRALALIHDRLGPIALPAEAKPLAAMVLGLQGTGKSSLLAASVLADARDENCAVIVLDAKNEFAHAALSVLPEDFGRRIHFLDFKAPLEGYNFFNTRIARGALVDMAIGALRAIHEEDSIRKSSERYLNAALHGVIAWAERTRPAGGATWQDVSEVLNPHVGHFRERVVAAIADDPGLREAHKLLGEEFPADVEASKGQMTIRIDAPRNAVQALYAKPSLDALLRHPVPIDLDEIVARREVLVVAASVEDFGEQQGEALLQLLLHGIHHAVARQRGLPQRERARVALKIDEAHYLFSDTYSKMLSMDRSAGLEVMSAWQEMAQIEDRLLREQIAGLHRNKFIFAVNQEDADLMAQALQPARSGQVRDDQQSRSRMRIPADALYHMDNHHMACSVLAGPARLAAFVGQTFRLPRDEQRIEGHLERIRERGGHDPGQLGFPERGTPPASPRARVERRVSLDVPWVDKDEVKALGAEWDRSTKTWYITEAADRARFGRWLSEEEEALAASAEAARGEVNPALPAAAEESGKPEAVSSGSGANGHAGNGVSGEGGATKLSDMLFFGSREDAMNGADARRAEFERFDGSRPSEPRPESREESTEQEAAPQNGRSEAEDSAEEQPAETESVGALGEVVQALERASGLDDGGDRVRVAPIDEEDERGVPDALSELDVFDNASGDLLWDEPERTGFKRSKKDAYRLAELEAKRGARSAEENRELKRMQQDKGPSPRRDELEILRALHQMRYLLATQAFRQVMPTKTARTAQRRLLEMYHRGWVSRFTVATGQRGRSELVWCLTREGFEAARGVRGPRGEYIARGLEWAEPERRRASSIPHDLHAAAYLFALIDPQVAGPFVQEWRGPGGGQIDPPTLPVNERFPRGTRRRMTPADFKLPSGERIRGLQLEELEAVKPDGAVVLRLPEPGGASGRFEVLLEYERRPRPDDAVRHKLRRYDAFLTAGTTQRGPYRPPEGEPPLVVFVLADEGRVRTFAQAADELLTGARALSSRPRTAWNYVGRTHIYFTRERDLFLGSLRALKIPEYPPELRAELATRSGGRPRGGASPEMDFTQVEILGGERFLRKAALALF